MSDARPGASGLSAGNLDDEVVWVQAACGVDCDLRFVADCGEVCDVLARLFEGDLAETFVASGDEDFDLPAVDVFDAGEREARLDDACLGGWRLGGLFGRLRFADGFADVDLHAAVHDGAGVRCVAASERRDESDRDDDDGVELVHL